MYNQVCGNCRNVFQSQSINVWLCAICANAERARQTEFENAPVHNYRSESPPTGAEKVFVYWPSYILLGPTFISVPLGIVLLFIFGATNFTNITYLAGCMVAGGLAWPVLVLWTLWNLFTGNWDKLPDSWQWWLDVTTK